MVIEVREKLTPSRVLVVGRENSLGSRPMANSVREFACCSHVGEFERTLFTKVIIEAAGNANFSPSRQDNIADNF